MDRIHALSKIDRWFLYRLEHLVRLDAELQACGTLEAVPDELLREVKRLGFSDAQVAGAFQNGTPEAAVRARRKAIGLVPSVKQIDTLAAEYPAATSYLYLTYGGSEHDIAFERDGRSVVVLGSGAYRIGSSVEFDWCGVQALKTLRENGFRSIMVNYNPETVSTDYDLCDRLYFDELSFERVMDIVELEAPHVVVVSTGGQIPNNLALPLYRAGVPVLGTSPADIDRAEDREKFSAMLGRIGVDQPEWSALTTREAIGDFIGRVGFPVLVRPSYVLSGAAARRR